MSLWKGEIKRSSVALHRALDYRQAYSGTAENFLRVKPLLKKTRGRFYGFAKGILLAAKP